MANIKIKIIILIFLFLFLNTSFCIADDDTQDTMLPSVDVSQDVKDGINDGDYEKIYNGLKEADFDYIFGIDPYQTDDYTKYMYSPYPLFRSGVTLQFKSKLIPPGYYLLTPREKNGNTYILFKEHGKVVVTIPVYKVSIVPEMYYEEKFPQLKLTKTQKAGKGIMGFIGTKWGKRNQRTPIPQAYIEFNDAGLYWDMILYYGNKKYYLIFKKG